MIGAKSCEIGARNSVIGAKSFVIGARNSVIEAKSSEIGARNSVIGAKSSEIGARNSVDGAKCINADIFTVFTYSEIQAKRIIADAFCSAHDSFYPVDHAKHIVNDSLGCVHHGNE
ncbi:MAG: hypothetical protein ACM3SY_19545 [Candidatus Omnitrophota bacterium]